ncbi:MAG TPA: ABC transporter substrate-binding protein [Jiangellaceae bacterium]|nr:ABC transporter substrate-binding protein [Jiangellaceae bacterium]
MSKTRRGAAVLGGLTGLALVLAACGGDDDGDDTAGTDGDEGAVAEGCEEYEKYGDLTGTTVTVFTSIVAPEDQPHIDSWAQYMECTGGTVTYEGTKEFEAQLLVRIQAGTPPDIAYMPQPGLLRTIVTDTEAVVPVAELAEEHVDQYYSEDWKNFGVVDGTFYASPIGANVKSFIWYSPSMFEEAGYEIPETWDDLIALTDDIVANGGKPWCAGIESGVATGWPATDWMEDIMLREAGPEVYDQWTNHDIPFNSPEVASTLERVGSILKNDDYVNGGFGDVRSIASTAFQDGGLPILEGNCWMHRQASFYQANWPEGTNVAEDGDVFAFYLPPIDPASGKPLLIAGEFAAAFDDRPEVQAFQAFLASPEWSNAKAEVSGPGWLSANSELDVELLKSPIDQLSAELLRDPETVARFDASDIMPGEVGSGTFWREMTEWIASDKPDDQVLDAIEESWPE